MVGLGDTAKKIQTLADRAEEMYQKLNELRDQVAETREKVGDTHDRVVTLEGEVAQQRALLKAMARESGVDVDAVLTEAAIEEAEAGGPADGGAGTTADAGVEGDATEASVDAAIGEADGDSGAGANEH